MSEQPVNFLDALLQAYQKTKPKPRKGDAWVAWLHQTILSWGKVEIAATEEQFIITWPAVQVTLRLPRAVDGSRRVQPFNPYAPAGAKPAVWPNFVCMTGNPAEISAILGVPPDSR